MLIQAQAPAAHARSCPGRPAGGNRRRSRRCTSSCPTRIPTTPTWAATSGAHTGYTAATGVVSLNASEAFRIAGPAQLARCPCPHPAAGRRRRRRGPALRRPWLAPPAPLAAGAARLSRTGALQAGRRRAGIGRSRSDRLGRQRRARPGGFHALATALGAAVGASRVPVDDGRFPRSQQIGATGKPSAPACTWRSGISGAVQHAGASGLPARDRREPGRQRAADPSAPTQAHHRRRAQRDARRCWMKSRRARQAARTPLETPHG